MVVVVVAMAAAGSAFLRKKREGSGRGVLTSSIPPRSA
jgi:hypothetical protein